MPARPAILTTADAIPMVMQMFAASLSRLGAEAGVRPIWFVVDGLHAYIEMPSLPHITAHLDVRWIRPETPLPQLSAILYGLARIDAPMVVVMDPDMHENLADLPRFYAVHEAGAEIVFGWRIERTGISFFRRLLTNLFNRLARKLLDLPLHDLNTPMVSFTKTGLECLLRCPADSPSPRLHTYRQMKEKLGEIPIRVAELTYKKSTYTLHSRIRIGAARTQEIFAFWQKYRSRQLVR